MDPISTQQLQYFHTLARHGSYSRAAEELSLSQPALSRSIQALERTLGRALVERERGRTSIALTEAGRETLAHADEILTRLTALRELSSAPDRPRLAFGIGPQYATAFLARALLGLDPAIVDPSIDVTIGSTHGMMAMLLAGDLEFIVSGTATRPLPDRVSAQFFRRSRQCVFVREGHPLTRVDDLTLEALEPFPIYCGSSFRDRVALSDDRVRRTLAPALTLDQYEPLERITAESDGVLIAIPGITTRPLVTLDVDLSHVAGRTESFVYTLASLRLSPLAQLVLDGIGRAHDDLGVTAGA